MNLTTRSELLEVCRLVYDRSLTNAAGSNFSARASADMLYMTPTGNAKHNRLRMTADDLMLVDFSGNILEGHGELSVSWSTHLRMYQEFDCVGAVIHAHPRVATAFACQDAPMPPLLDGMKKYGEIPVIMSGSRGVKVDSREFGDLIVEIFRAKGEGFCKHGHGVFYANHGLLVAAPNLDDAFDLLERIEYNAEAILNSALLGLSGFGK
jgi:L-fuculose-phosphate aldolase